MKLDCTCSDLVNNGDHYCPIHGTFAAPTPPEGEADPLSPLLDMSVVEGLSEELRKAKAEGEAVPEQRDKFCVFCGKTDHLEDGHKHIPGPRAVPNYCRYCGVQIQRSVGGAISFGTHKDDCPRKSPAAPVVSTAAPEPPIGSFSTGYLRYQDEVLKKPCGQIPVAPESYKPAEEVSLQWPTNLPPTGMGAIDAITDLWTCDLKGLTAEEIKQAARIIDSLLEHVRRDPASTPVTVEAPGGIPQEFISSLEKKVRADFDYPEGGIILSLIAEINRLRATPKPIGDVEAVARQIYLETEGFTPLGKQHFQCTKADQVEIDKITAILSPFFAPAGPEKLLTRFDEFDDQTHPCNKWWDEHGQYMMSGGCRREFIWACRGWIAHEQFAAGVEVTGDSLHETKPTIQAQPPCSECATLREKLEQWTKWGVVEVAVRNPQVAEYCEHWEGRVEKAEAECAMLRKERDDSEKAIAKSPNARTM